MPSQLSLPSSPAHGIEPGGVEFGGAEATATTERRPGAGPSQGVVAPEPARPLAGGAAGLCPRAMSASADNQHLALPDVRYQRTDTHELGLELGLLVAKGGGHATGTFARLRV